MNERIRKLKEQDKVRLDYVGQTLLRGCLVNVALDDKGMFTMYIVKKGQYPTHTDIVTARYKCLPDNCYMAIILPPVREYSKEKKFSITLWELKDDRNDSNKNKRKDSESTDVRRADS